MSDQFSSILSALAAALKADSAIAAYCLANFGRAPQIFIGFDTANPPPAEGMPWIALVPVASAIDDSLDTREYQIDIGFAGINSSIDTTTAGVTKYVGFEKLFEVADKIQTVISATLQPSSGTPTIAYTIKDLGRPAFDFAHPRYLASWSIRAASAI